MTTQVHDDIDDTLAERDDAYYAQPRTYSDDYPLDYNGYAVVSRPFIRIRADEIQPRDLLILDSGLSRVTAVTHHRLDNAVTVVHVTGPTNVVRATHEIVTVLR